MPKTKKHNLFEKHFEYINFNAPVIYFKVDKEGRIKEVNQYCKKVFGQIPNDTIFQDLIIDFNSEFNLNDAIKSSKNHLLSISTESGTPESYLFTFISNGNEILIFAHLDIKESDLVRNKMVLLNQEISNTTRELHKKNAQLQQALDHIKTLHGIIPICAHCHKIRNDDQIWKKLETYLSENTDARLSHGICPECLKEHFSDFIDDE